jgi:hypothetical protein
MSACGRTDWKSLEAFERNHTERLCQHFLPNGKRVGQEWRIGDVSGQPSQSLGVQLTGVKAGLWHDRATGEGGNFHKLIAASRGYSEEDAVSDIERTFGVSFHRSNGASSHRRKPDLAPSWEAARIKAREHTTELAQWRGFSPEDCEWLIDHRLIGMTQKGEWCTPVYDSECSLVALHIKPTSGKWFYEPKGVPICPLIFGDLSMAKTVHVFESQWDMYALMLRSGCYLVKYAAFFCTRGASNAKLITRPSSRRFHHNCLAAK